MYHEQQILGFIGSEPEPPNQRNCWWLFITILIFTVLFSSILSQALNAIRPVKLPYVDTKLDYLKKNIGKYDTLVIGTSRIFRGFDPTSFDTVNRELGCNTNTFNLGIPDMRVRELDVLIDRLGKLDLENIRNIVFDPQINPDATAAFFKSERGSRLMRWKYVPLTFRNIWADLLPKRMKLERSLIVAKSFFTEGFGIGKMSLHISADKQKPEYSSTIDFGKTDGYIALDLDAQLATIVNKRIERFRKPDVQARWVQHRDRVAKRNGRLQPVPEDRLALISEFADRLNKLPPDIRYLFVSQPVLLEQSRYLKKRLDEKYSTNSILIDLDDSPGLFDPLLWFDEAHFNSTGAALAAKTLATQFCING